MLSFVIETFSNCKLLIPEIFVYAMGLFNFQDIEVSLIPIILEFHFPTSLEY